MGRHNLIGCLHDSGRSAEAAALIPEARRMYEQVGARTDLPRLRWTEGRVLVALGGSPKPRRPCSRCARASSRRTWLSTPPWSRSISPALYLRQRRLEETKRLAAELIPIFQSHEICHEALASLVLFQQAAERGQLTGGLVEEIAAYLREARGNPHLRFRDEA